MKLLLLLSFFFLYYTVSFAQQKLPDNNADKQYYLVAQKTKHPHFYRERTPLTIFYQDSGNLLKASGRLFVMDSNHVELQRHNGKIINSIDPVSIIRIQRWKGPALVAEAIATGATMLLTIPLAVALDRKGPQFFPD